MSTYTCSLPSGMVPNSSSNRSSNTNNIYNAHPGRQAGRHDPYTHYNPKKTPEDTLQS